MKKIVNIKFLYFSKILNLKMLLIAIFCTLQINVSAQSINVTGKITDSSGESLPGVNIVIKGTTLGVSSDIEGNYSILAKPTDILVYSFVGHISQEVQVNNQTLINVLLEEDIHLLDEVVVVGYGVQKKSDITGSLSSISSAEIAEIHTVSLTNMMQGRAAGVSVLKSSGSPGSEASISIRGVGSINGMPPLWIVDGVPTSGDVNPLDIESMEILKDASATAIYGTKGAGGVILITTKKGKKGKIAVTFENKTGLGQMNNKVDLVGASDWARYRSEAYRNASLPVPPNLEGITGEGTDWQEEVTQSALSTNNFLSLSGASDQITYYMSIGHTTEEGIVQKTDDKNTAFRLNTSVQVTDWLKIGENFSFSSNTNHSVNEDDEWNSILIQAINIDPITSPTNEDGSWQGSDYTTIDNPVAHIDRTNNENKTYSGGGNAFLELTFLKDFNFTSRFGYEYSSANYYGFSPTFFVKTGEENTQSSISRDYSETENWVISNFLTWNHKYGNHDVKLMLGQEIEKNYTSYFGVSATDLISEEEHHRFIDNASGNQEASAYGSAIDTRWTSYFGRLNYNYKNKYLLTGNVRHQGSTLFGSDYKYGLFPSVSAGWKISEEDFFNIDMINNLKMRVSYGKTGNDNSLQPFAYVSISESGQRHVVGGEIVDGVSFPRIANPELHWEELVSKNIGLDIAFLKNQLTLSADYFISQTDDMLYNPDLAGHVGTQENPFTNFTSLQNSGFEFELGYKNNIKELKYSFNLTFSHVKNKILDLNTADEILGAEFMGAKYSITRVGSPIGSYYGLTTDGLFQNQAEIDAHVDSEGNPLQNNVAPGDIRYKDADGDGNLDLDIIGNPFPDFEAGLNIRLEYKRFEFITFLYGVYGNDVFNLTKFYTHNSSMRYNVSPDIDNRWLQDGDTNDPNECRLNLNDVNNNLRSDRYIEDGSYLRINNIQLGYNIPDNLLSKLSMSSLNIYVGAQNLYTFTKYSGYDPEIGVYQNDPLDRGIDRATYPNPRVYYIGLNVKF
jgi:TonB-linked SusC/RagA family outer membrane protein